MESLFDRDFDWYSLKYLGMIDKMIDPKSLNHAVVWLYASFG